MIFDASNGAIRVGYFVRIPNVGDMANSSVVSILTGSPVKFTLSQSQPYLLAIGSIMASAAPHSIVWGTGVMHPDFGTGAALAANIHAVRGKLSHFTLNQNGVNLGDVPLGDPGYLLPGLFGIARSATPRFKVGLVCHYVDRYHRVMLRMMKESGVIDLNVHLIPEVFLKNMAECEVVISTSLHGLIFAEALGIPNLWVKASDEIGGGEFKFQDWYSTTAQPQLEPHSLTSNDTALSLANQAELRYSTIDIEALLRSFPHHRLDELKNSNTQITVPVDACRARPTPVFLISFNRGEMLKRAIASIRGLSRPTEIIVHDNGSDDIATIEILNQLEVEGIKVFRYPPILTADDLNQVNETVQDFFSSWGEPIRYVVSDCDVDLSVADPCVLDIYDELLNKFRHVECVGPMLRIRDIPLSYPLFNRVMNRHIEQFWKHTPNVVRLSSGEVAILEAAIDTTFALHRAGEPFRRMKKGVRVYEPFEALHLDWYKESSDEDVFFKSSSSRISHWNNESEFLRYGKDPLEYSDFFAVRKNVDGELEIYKEIIPGKGTQI